MHKLKYKKYMQSAQHYFSGHRCLLISFFVLCLTGR